MMKMILQSDKFWPMTTRKYDHKHSPLSRLFRIWLLARTRQDVFHSNIEIRCIYVGLNWLRASFFVFVNKIALVYQSGAITRYLFPSGPFPSTGTDIWWLLKHVWLAQASSMHPTGMLSCIYIRYKINTKLS